MTQTMHNRKGFPPAGPGLDGHGAAKRRQRRAFTLVELLAVILVLAILVAITVGVASKVIQRASAEETKAFMRVIMNAVEIYRDETGNYPNPGGADWRAQNANLFNMLKSNPAAKKRLAALPPDALKTGGTTYFLDGFKNLLKYVRQGGHGGGPYLVSPGADGDFSHEEDNIRSDEL